MSYSYAVIVERHFFLYIRTISMFLLIDEGLKNYP